MIITALCLLIGHSFDFDLPIIEERWHGHFGGIIKREQKAFCQRCKKYRRII